VLKSSWAQAGWPADTAMGRPEPRFEIALRASIDLDVAFGKAGPGKAGL
jgi:hypothetical protein